MSFNETVKNCMISYPSLFHSKYDVMHHMFLVLGNGYEWKNGQLVSLYDENITKDPIESAIRRAQDFIGDLKSISNIDNEIAKTIELSIKVEMLTEDLKNLIQFEANFNKSEEDYLNEHGKETLYPAQLDLCKIGSIPENIQDDWCEAIIYYIEFLDRHQELLDKITLADWHKFIDVKNNLKKK